MGRKILTDWGTTPREEILKRTLKVSMSSKFVATAQTPRYARNQNTPHLGLTPIILPRSYSCVQIQKFQHLARPPCASPRSAAVPQTVPHCAPSRQGDNVSCDNNFAVARDQQLRELEKLLVSTQDKPTRLTLIEHKRETLKPARNPIATALDNKFYSDIEGRRGPWHDKPAKVPGKDAAHYIGGGGGGWNTGQCGYVPPLVRP